MSAAHRISEKVQSRNRHASIDWDASLMGETSALFPRLQKIRARSITTTQGSFVSPIRELKADPATPRHDDSTDSHDSAHDHLHWKDHLLTWTQGSVLVRTLSFASPILQAFWTLFSVSSPDHIEVAPGKTRPSQHSPHLQRALCVFFEQAIHVHFPGLGEQFDMDLPFRFAKAFLAPVGFLVQRQIETEDERIASTLQRPPPVPADAGYPFPDLSNPTDSSYSLSHVLDDAPTSPFDQDVSRLLPMVFYLARCYDDLVPVERYPQLSFASTPSDDPEPMTHGPAHTFGEMDETVVYVSPENDEHVPSFVVTMSLRNSAIRVYAFAARPNAFKPTATLLSTPRIPSTLTISKSNGRLDGVDPHSNGVQADEDYQQHINNGTRPSLGTPAATAGSNSNGLGRGYPSNLRRSARIDLDRRTSGLTSAGMGRDPSGRSRRISAMHSGAADRRSAGRKDEQATQGRDRTLGNISHTADGLRLRSQTYQHDTMMEELGAGGTSMRISTNTASAARLRRSSQAAARTPYAGPRMSNRTSSSGTKVRPSMTLSRFDASLDAGRLTSNLAPSAADGIRTNTVDTGLSDENEVDLARIAGMDSFARSFACVCLLDEIKVSSLASHSINAQVKVESARFSHADADAAFLFLSVPSINQTFCRRLGYQRIGSTERTRKLPFCKAPSKALASSTIASSSLARARLLSRDSTELLTFSREGKCELHFGPPSSTLLPLDLSNYGPVVDGLKRLSEDTSAIRIVTAAGSCSAVRLVSTRSQDCVKVDMNLRPRCSATSKVLSMLTKALPCTLSAKFKARWIQERFLSQPTSFQADGPAAVSEDWLALRKAFGALSHTENAATSNENVADSIAERLFGNDPLLSCLAPLKSASPTAVAAQAPPTIESALHTGETYHVLLALYLYAEESRLHSSKTDRETDQIVQLAAAVAYNQGADTWTDAFRSRFPAIKVEAPASRAAQTREVSMVSAPPADFYDVLLGMISGTAAYVDSLQGWIRRGSTDQSLEHVCAAFPLLESLIQVFAVFQWAHDGPKSRAAAVVDRMISCGLDLERLRQLPFGVSLPLYQAIRCCQSQPPKGKSADFYRTIQRAELVLNTSMQRSSLQSASSRNLPKQLIRTLPEGASLDSICAQLFSQDFRLRDAVKMLQTDSVNAVYVAEGENQTEAAVAEQHGAAAAAVCERTKALPPGRAMLLMTSRPFSPTHKWRIASICLAVKVRPRGTTIEPDAKGESSGLDWPEFHNGVASVLELNLTADVRVDSKWIFAHLGEQVTARHAGFLYGLGLMKQLPSLTPVHVFRYLKMRNNLLTIGFLLGMAVSTVGTADPTARHLIGMQLTAFLPPGSAPLNLSMITQTAGLLAMGLVFLGSNHLWTAKRMLDQIGAQESAMANIQPQHREAYSMAAGLALGLVYLGKGRGDRMKSLPDKRIISRLVHLIKGSSDLGHGGLFARSDHNDDTLKDEPEINLTSAPAALAFGLVYLRTGNQTIAGILDPPRAPHELDSIRPDVLFAHVLARSLILWDAIQPSKAWLHSCLPEWMQKRISRDKPLSEAAQLAQINMQAGACFAIGLKYAGSKDQQARDCLWEQLDKLERQVKVQTVSFFSKIRKATVRAALDQVRISLGMVMAGSGDVDLLRHLRRAHGDVDSETCYGSHMATHMALGLLFLGGGRFTLGTSDLAVAALLISFLPPFPRWSGDNRAHLQAFHHLWYLAIEPRLLVATDVDTNQLVSLPVSIASKDTGSRTTREFTPVLLPNQGLSGPIKSDSGRYWPASIESKSVAEQSVAVGSVASMTRGSTSSTSQVLFVKRKMAHLDYSADPHGSRSLSSRTLDNVPMDLATDAAGMLGAGVAEVREAMQGFAGSGKHRELVRCLGQASVTSTADSAEELDAIAPLVRTVAMECLLMDKMFVLPAYLGIVQLQHDLSQDSQAWLRHYRDLRFADEFYLHYTRLFAADADEESRKQSLLIQPDLLASLRRQAQQHAKATFEADAMLREAITDHLMASPDQSIPLASAGGHIKDMQLVLIGSEAPSADEVRRLIRVMRDFMDTPPSGSSLLAGKVRTKQLKAHLGMIADTAFGRVERPPWTTYILDHIIDRLVSRADLI